MMPDGAKIKVIMKRIDSVPYTTFISPTLKNMQKLVDGYIAYWYPFEGRNIVVVCNEEGYIRNMPINCYIGEQLFYGDIFLTGINRDGELEDIDMKIKELKQLAPEMWEVEHD